jgi:integrase
MSLHGATRYDYCYGIMASIHKDPRGKSPFFYCAYRLPNGKRTFRSTKLSDRAAALKFCRSLEYASHESRAGRLTEARALELLSEIVEQTTGEALRSYTAEGWLREWVAGKKSAKASATTIKYEGAIERFIESLGPRAGINLRQILPRDVLRFRESEVASGKHSSTCNDYLGIVRSAFSAARKQGLITHNPAEAVERLRNESEASRRPFTLDEIRALLRASDGGDWYGAILVALYTGMRLHDAANLKWESIDLDGRWISYKASKTRTRIKVPMHDALYGWLKKRIRGINKASLFPELAGKSTSLLSPEFAKVMARADVRGEIVRDRHGESGRLVTSLGFHSLRHAYASLMANRGVAEEVRMKLAGHSSAEIHQGYTHHEAAVLRAGVGQLPDVTR